MIFHRFDNNSHELLSAPFSLPKQVLFSNSLGFFWNIYLTWAMNKEELAPSDGIAKQLLP